MYNALLVLSRNYNYVPYAQQDTVNRLFSGKSYTERGTLSRMKNEFGHRSMSTDVMNNFNHVENFLRFATEAHVVYLMCNLCNMEDISSEPACLPDQSLSSYLYEKCEKLVDEVWMLSAITAVLEVVDSEAEEHYVSDNWCNCGKGSNSYLYIICCINHSLIDQSIKGLCTSAIEVT